MENQLKEMLRRDKIRLWLSPFANEDLTPCEIPSDLVEKYSKEKGWSSVSVRECLVHLQATALDRLTANKVFEESGVATLYVIRVKQEGNESTAEKNEGHQKVHVLLTVDGKVLREAVAELLGTKHNSFKIIASGQVLDDKKMLQEQGIAQFSELLCVFISPQETEAEQQRIWQMSVDQTRKAVSHLANQVEIADQYGNPLELPDAEKHALSTGIALHEKGKKELKAKQIGLALLCFLEADKEFKLCRSSILQMVDNYPILCLDIVWCYLELQSVASLPDAETRLKDAENGFRKSYGVNFERLAVLKHGVEHEKVLIIRLQILQGIVAYFKKNYKRAFNLFMEAEACIRQLDVDGEKLYQIVQMGYSESEARLGLRATNNNVDQAVQRIITEREDAERRRKERNERYKNKLLEQKLGLALNGNKIDLKLYRNLLSMGFKKQFAVEALRESNNDLNGALESLYAKQSSGQVVSSSADGSDAVNANVQNSNASRLVSAAMQQLVDMGFVEDVLMSIVNRNRGDSAGAFAEVLSITDSLIQTASFSAEDQERLQNLIGEIMGETEAEKKVRSEDEAAWSTLEEDVSDDLNSHLDGTLEEEEHFLTTYKNLVLPHVQ